MVVNCPLCGYRFDPQSGQACASCPFHTGCEKVCCPNCQYSWVNSSSILDLFKKAFKTGDKKIGRS